MVRISAAALAFALRHGRPRTFSFDVLYIIGAHAQRQAGAASLFFFVCRGRYDAIFDRSEKPDFTSSLASEIGRPLAKMLREGRLFTGAISPHARAKLASRRHRADQEPLGAATIIITSRPQRAIRAYAYALA